MEKKSETEKGGRLRLKAHCQRFRAWQQEPFNYEFQSEETHCCQNCGHEFVGNYCPYCSQKAGLGRITWTSVYQGALELWGMGSRSMPYALWQLIWRPGYFIRDYISGKRQVSFPPVKMLAVLAVIITLLEYWFVPDAAERHAVMKNPEVSNSPLGVISYVKTFLVWIDAHQEWSLLFWKSFVILPIWWLFRNAPAYPRHTLAEGLFIQIFMSVLSLMITFVSDLFDDMLDWLKIVSSLVCYHQLFGYGWWGTIWRTVCVIACAVCIVAFVVLFLGVFVGLYEFKA